MKLQMQTKIDYYNYGLKTALINSFELPLKLIHCAHGTAFVAHSRFYRIYSGDAIYGASITPQKPYSDLSSSMCTFA